MGAPSIPPKGLLGLFPKAPCSFIVHIWALKGLPYHNFAVYVYTIKLHGAFGVVRSFDQGSCERRNISSRETAMSVSMVLANGLHHGSMW